MQRSSQTINIISSQKNHLKDSTVDNISAYVAVSYRYIVVLKNPTTVNDQNTVISTLTAGVRVNR